MMWRRKFSDREFVERTAQDENRWRRRLAIILVLGSLLYLGLAVWFYRLVSSGIYPIQEELFDQTHRDWFETGLLMGFFGGKFFYFATFTLVFGAYYLTS